MDINHILPPKMILFLQKIKHDVIPIKGSWLGTIPKHFGLNNEIQNLEYLNKCDFLTCLWRLCSVNASQSTCQLHSDYNTQLFLVPGPEKPHNSVHEQYSSVLQGRRGHLSFMCIHRLSSRTLLQLTTSSRQSPETSTSAGNIMPRYLIHQNVCFSITSADLVLLVFCLSITRVPP